MSCLSQNLLLLSYCLLLAVSAGSPLAVNFSEPVFLCDIVNSIGIEIGVINIVVWVSVLVLIDILTILCNYKLAFSVIPNIIFCGSNIYTGPICLKPSTPSSILDICKNLFCCVHFNPITMLIQNCLRLFWIGNAGKAADKTT